jgi:methionine-rich copper-binding protein CopC
MWLFALLASTAFVASAPAASAHARLVSISPSDGQTVPTPPRQVVITFSEDLLATAVRIEVHDAEGVPVADGKPVVAGAVATQPLVDGLSAGGYSVTYRVVSKDGHPVSGSTTFTARTAAATTTAPPPTTSTTPPESTTAPTTATGTPGATAPSSVGDPAEDGPNLLVRGVEALLVVAVAAGIFLLGRRIRAR